MDIFKEFNMDIGDDNSYVLNFAAWDRKGDICVKGDKDEDGNYDEEHTPRSRMRNQYVKKPTNLRLKSTGL